MDYAVSLSTEEQMNASIDEIDIHKECKNQCRSSIIRQYIKKYPESLRKADKHGNLPLHCLLGKSSSIDDALMMIEKYPEAVKHSNNYGDLPLHLECIWQSRSTVISKCIQLYPESLSKASGNEYLPLNCLLGNKSSSVDDALTMIENYPEAVKHRNHIGSLPIHIECNTQGRTSVIAKLFELYPESIVETNKRGNMPLHELLSNENQSSSIEDALMMIDKYPDAVRHISTRLSSYSLRMQESM
jgi:ankyrin repeat protein